MRALPLLPLVLALAGCHAATPDSLVSAAVQRDCSLLNLDRGHPYCRAQAGEPPPPPFCTRTLGSVTCWRSPPEAMPAYRGVADTPAGPPPAERNPGWPRLGLN
jgi:hypothetical protein